MPYGKKYIPGTCFLARARGNETVLPYGKKYSWHMPFGKGSGQFNSTSYLMPLCLLLFQANAYPFSY
jgi:hypothetical protein